MNYITAIFDNLSPAEQASLQATHDALAPQWDAGDEPTRRALELEFTEALNTLRSNYDL